MRELLPADGRRWWHKIANMIVIGRSSHYCFSLLFLESTNHRTILKPAVTAGPDGKWSFLFVVCLSFFNCFCISAQASDWLVFFLCIHLLHVTSILAPPTASAFGLWCHHLLSLWLMIINWLWMLLKGAFFAVMYVCFWVCLEPKSELYFTFNFLLIVSSLSFWGREGAGPERVLSRQPRLCGTFWEFPSRTDSAHSHCLCSNHNLENLWRHSNINLEHKRDDITACPSSDWLRAPLSLLLCWVIVVLLLLFLHQEPISGSTCRLHDGNKGSETHLCPASVSTFEIYVYRNNSR